ncbi:hypothetical protein H4S06_005047, partial [Coemansia sp. BCRC 34490]
VPLGRQLFRYADHVLQIAVGAGIRIYKGLIVAKPALLEILELLSRVDFYAPAVSTFIWVSENVAPAIVRGPRHAWRAFYAWIKQSAWIVGVLWDAYARLRDYLLVPFTHALFRGCTALWQSIVHSSISIAAWRWLATVAWPLVFQALAHCLRESDRLFAALSARLWELLCTQGVLFSRWYAHCTLLLANGSVVVAAVWPLVCRGFDDGVDAMRDVYRRLLVAMDNAVAAVGDKVVELAHKGAVHDETHAHGHNPPTKPDLALEQKRVLAATSMGIELDPRNTADLVVVVLLSCIFAINLVAVVFLIFNRKYPPLKSKSPVLMVIMFVASVFWFVGDLQVNGHVTLAGSVFTNCRGFGFWVRVLLGICTVTAVVAIRTHAFYH